jgi:hypothetical protein
MIRIIIIANLLICISLVTGCSSLAPGSSYKQITERDGVDIGLIPASYREVYLSPEGSKERHCRAPAPDFTVQASEQFKLAIPGINDEELDSGENQSALSLGGRSPLVLISRELLYRACELSSNINADTKTTLSIYQQFLDVLEKIASTQNQQGTKIGSGSSQP